MVVPLRVSKITYLLFLLFVLSLLSRCPLLGNPTTWGRWVCLPKTSHLHRRNGKKKKKFCLRAPFCLPAACYSHQLESSHPRFFVSIACLHVATTNSPFFPSSPSSFKINVLCATLLRHGLIQASRGGVLELVSLSLAAQSPSRLSRMLDKKLIQRRWRHPQKK